MASTTGITAAADSLLRKLMTPYLSSCACSGAAVFIVIHTLTPLTPFTWTKSVDKTELEAPWIPLLALTVIWFDWVSKIDLKKAGDYLM